MCLRFLLEGNVENQGIVEGLKPRGGAVTQQEVPGGGGRVETLSESSAEAPKREVKDVLQAFGEEMEKVEEMLMKGSQAS